MKLAVLAVLVGCGSPAPEPVPVAPPPPAPKPAPGADLDGPIAPPQPDVGPPQQRVVVPLDLAADRAIVKVGVPVPPHGGAVGFTFADDRPGWVARIPDSRQLPAVAYGNDKVYVSGGFESVSFYALDATTGRIEWATTQLEDNGPTAAVIEGDDVLFNTESCTLFSLNAKTGKRNWFRYLGDPTLSQVAVADGLVYASHPTEATGGQALSAYRTKTGVPVWSAAIDSELLATPVVAGDAIYVSTIGGSTYRFDRRSGKLGWRKPLRATTAPWIAGEELFVTRRQGGKEQQIVAATATGKVLREYRTSTAAYAGDVPAGIGRNGDDTGWKRVWAFEGSRPIVDRGIHYVAMGNEVFASDAQTGEPLWHRRYAGATGRALGSVALAGSTIVVSSRDGKVFGLDVDTGYTLWSYDIGHQVVAEPIVAMGWVYAATADGFVVALDVADKSLDGWHMFGGNPQKNGAVIPPTAVRPAEAARATTTTTDPIDTAQQSVDRDERDAIARKEAERKALIERQRRAQPFTLSDACRDNPLCN